VIVRPTASQLLGIVRAELSTRIASALDDQVLQASLTMVDSMLASVAVRCDHEVAWILDEIAEAEAIGCDVVAAGVPGAAAVAEALQVLREHRTSSFHVPDLLGDYDRAGEVLSRSLEAAMPVGGLVCERAEAALATRIEHATVIRGEFSLAGRE
jgi:hypothetical protein